MVGMTAPPTFTALQTAIFTPICSVCHNGTGTQLPGSMNLTTAASSYAALVNVPSLERPTLMRVKPGDSTNSWIVHKLLGQDIDNTARMPFGGPFLDASTIQGVMNWIDAGAANN